MGVYEDCVEDFLRLVSTQATVFVVVAALSMPAQKSVEPASNQNHCMADSSYYIRIAANRYYVIIAVFCSAFLAGNVRSQISLLVEAWSMTFWTRFRVRAKMVAAVLFSVAATAIAVPTSIYFVEVTTMTLSCLPATDRSLINVSYAILSIVCSIVYLHFLRVAILV